MCSALASVFVVHSQKIRSDGMWIHMDGPAKIYTSGRRLVCLHTSNVSVVDLSQIHQKCERSPSAVLIPRPSDTRGMPTTHMSGMPLRVLVLYSTLRGCASGRRSACDGRATALRRPWPSGVLVLYRRWVVPGKSRDECGSLRGIR